MHRQFLAVLGAFPFSPQAPYLGVRVVAVDPAEPAVVEQVLDWPQQRPDLEALLNDWRASDTCFEIEGHWDLWQLTEAGWRLEPSRVVLYFYGPSFPSEAGEQFRIDLGLDFQFLPSDSAADAERNYLQSNIRSLVRLNADLSRLVRISRRSLWADSGDDLAERLERALAVTGSQPN